MNESAIYMASEILAYRWSKKVVKIVRERKKYGRKSDAKYLKRE